MHEGHQDLLEGIDKEKPKEKKAHHGHDHHEGAHAHSGMSEGLKKALIVLAAAGVLIIVFRIFAG